MSSQKKIGEVIVEHLLTGDMIKRKLEDAALQKEVTLTIQQLFEEKMSLQTTPDELAELAGFKGGKERLIQWVADKIEQELTRFLEEKKRSRTTTICSHCFKRKYTKTSA
ncbi:hypothetical protein [Listeria fleischmannii]|uniref:hypothetical protein n=1 Tax=Listeria fleischmannii TaxID=1069827 RepID=UPI0004B8F759|nr:hypothetical protein [Listeria fleischmannii]